MQKADVQFILSMLTFTDPYADHQPEHAIFHLCEYVQRKLEREDDFVGAAIILALRTITRPSEYADFFAELADILDLAHPIWKTERTDGEPERIIAS